MGYNELRSMLSHYIGAVFDNESEFIDAFLPDFEDGDCIEVSECYMAGSRVRLEIFNIDTGNHITTTISTMAFCEWVDELDAKIT